MTVEKWRIRVIDTIMCRNGIRGGFWRQGIQISQFWISPRLSSIAKTVPLALVARFSPKGQGRFCLRTTFIRRVGSELLMMTSSECYLEQLTVPASGQLTHIWRKTGR